MQFWLDGQALGVPYRGYHATVQPGPHLVLGPVQLQAGKHVLSVQTAKAEGGNPWIGLAAVALTRE